ncbi:MAG TPA: hypothetical protein VIS94_13335 [Desulfomonilia bacterium]
MNRFVKYAAIIVCMAFFVAIAACSSNKNDESTVVSLETGAENITSLGEFPVGIRDYTPPAIEITSPLSVNPVTTVANDGSVYLKEVVPGEKWSLEVKGEVTPSTFGIKRNRLELKGVYVNRQLVDSANGDDIKWVDGKFTFTKTIYISKEDIAGTFYPIIIAAVDEKNYVSGAKSVVILQDRAANKIGKDYPLANSLHLSGNKEFVSNALPILVSQIDGLNFAPYLGNINILVNNVLSPRTVMLQGVTISDYSINSAGADLCSINLDIKVSNLVVEYTNNYSIFNPGQNVVNINMKNIEIDGLVIELRKEGNGIKAYLKAGDIALVKGEGFKYNLDTPFTEIFNYLLDNVFSFLIQDVFKQTNQKPVQLKLGYYALRLLIKQLSGDETALNSDAITGLKYCTKDNNGGINLGMDINFTIDKESKSKLTSTYSSSKAKSDKLDLAVNYGNSTFALSDDMINQMLAMNFPDDTQEITDLDLNELIDELGIDLGDYKLWPWLRDGNDKLPNIKIKYQMPTPPVLKIQGNGNYIGSLYVRNVLVEVWELDDQGKDVELLARLSISLDIAMKWDNGKFVLECGKGDATYLLLFNKLYPMLIPEQMKEIHTYIANNLNQLLSKIGLIGYPIENVSTMNDAYLVFSGKLEEEINSEPSPIATFYSKEWNRKPLSSNPGASYRMINDKIVEEGSNPPDNDPENDIFLSLFFKSIDGNGNVVKDMDWNDSCGYFYTLPEKSNCLITGISFDRNIAFDFITGNTVEFYEEFAVMCIAYGEAAASIDKEEFIPGNGCAIPFEFSVEDIIPDTIKMPLTKNVGIGIRVKKDPSIPLKANPIALQMASASNIKIKYIDLNIDQGLKF